MIEFGIAGKTPQYHGPGGKPEVKQGKNNKEDYSQPATDGYPVDDQIKTTGESQKDNQIKSEEDKEMTDKIQKNEQTEDKDDKS